FMLPKKELQELIGEKYDWSGLFQFHLDQMMADPELTEEEKQELLRQLELPEEEWQPTELPAGAEPLSVTVIKMRRGE
ncbi:MAG: hypothetical protein ACRD82_22515, partial [Blastocatellia bacterium]